MNTVPHLYILYCSSQFHSCRNQQPEQSGVTLSHKQDTASAETLNSVPRKLNFMTQCLLIYKTLPNHVLKIKCLHWIFIKTALYNLLPNKPGFFVAVLISLKKNSQGFRKQKQIILMMSAEIVITGLTDSLKDGFWDVLNPNARPFFIFIFILASSSQY